MDDQTQVLRVSALVELRESDRGGRLTPIANKYRPNLKINGVDGYAGFLLGEGLTMAPGACGVVELAMVGTASFLSEVKLGRLFSIHEGSRQVGKGSIEAIIEGSVNEFLI